MLTLMFSRLLMAALLGGIIGLERDYRAKEAGLRTHFMVSLGSALFTLISLYGFQAFNTLGGSSQNPIDPTRIAAQIVSGIGFIGAGTIVIHRKAVIGLTTAAGIWATAAIGMAAGCGLHVIACLSTLLILLGFESLRYVSMRIGHGQQELNIEFDAHTSEQAQTALRHLRNGNRQISSYSIQPSESGYHVSLTLWVTERVADISAYVDELQAQPGIQVLRIE